MKETAIKKPEGRSTAIAVLQDARVELKLVLDHGIEFAEKSAASLFRFARKLGQRLDEGVAETLGNAERYLTAEHTEIASQTA